MMSETSHDWHSGENRELVDSEEFLLNTNQAIRVQALSMAVQSFPVADNLSTPWKYDDVVLARSEVFEEYIKNGVIHNA
jgi:hypothetical protein